MNKNPAMIAVATAILVAGAMLLGSMAFPRVEIHHAAAPAHQPEPAMRVETPPSLTPMRVAPKADTAALEARVSALESQLAEVKALLEKVDGEIGPFRELMALVKKKIAQTGSVRPTANETAAIATLRNATSAQAQVQASGRIDTDGDGSGEYGGFLEMSGAIEGRMGKVLIPPVLSSAFRKMPEGVVIRSGYCYRIFLPSSNGEGIGETPAGYANDGSVDADLAETTWCCYAWPQKYGVTGTRTFMMNQGGDSIATDDSRYSGPNGGPSSDAAFVQSGAITGLPALGRKGSDGNTWKQVN